MRFVSRAIFLYPEQIIFWEGGVMMTLFRLLGIHDNWFDDKI